MEEEPKQPSRSNHDEEQEGMGMAWMYCAVVVQGSVREGRRERLAAVRSCGCYVEQWKCGSALISSEDSVRK